MTSTSQLIRITLIIAASTAALAGCSNTASRPNISYVLLDNTGQNGRACINTSDIRGYGLLDQDVISIDAGRHYYLATVMPGCIDLASSTRAIFSSRFAQVCGGGMDRIHTQDDSCTIRTIFEFDNRETAFEVHGSAIKARNAAADNAEQ